MKEEEKKNNSSFDSLRVLKPLDFYMSQNMYIYLKEPIIEPLK